MQIIERIEKMRGWSAAERRQQRTIVLVPTMGFLHEGHLALVRDGRKRGSRLVVSIFVNPTQFAPHEDWSTYPRDFARDQELLEKEGVDVVFHPSVAEMYPGGYQTRVQVEELGARLCGAFRPGHFAAVATVVAKLFNIVEPDTAIFGRKDYQQLLVVQRMARDLSLAVEILGHPIVREADGLAMSSRNSYLNPGERRAALCLSRSLNRAQCLVNNGERRTEVILARIRGEIIAEPLARLEYASVSDPETLVELKELNGSALLALAVWVGKARLIDNTVLEPGRTG
jgi:pantoate--beta-alanine ligase